MKLIQRYYLSAILKKDDDEVYADELAIFKFKTRKKTKNTEQELKEYYKLK